MSLRRFIKSALHHTVSPSSGVRRGLSAFNYGNVPLNDAYAKTKSICESKKLPLDVDSKGVFACNELDLKEIRVYGFDYDYTLAVYKSSMDSLLYNLSLEALINKFKYPRGIKDLPFDPNFAIRGLHYDIEKGLLMKLDSFLQIQLGTVYKGLSPMPDVEVLKLYKNKTVPLHYVENQGRNSQALSGLWYVQLEFFNPPSYFGKPYLGGLRCSMVNGIMKSAKEFILEFYGFNGDDLLYVNHTHHPSRFDSGPIHITAARPDFPPANMSFTILDTDYNKYAMFYTCLFEKDIGYDVEHIRVASRYPSTGPLGLYLLKGRADRTLQRLGASVNPFKFENVTQDCMYYSTKMVQLADIFSVTEMCLLCNVAEYFERNSIDYHPEILFRDVKTSVGSCHPVMHKIVQGQVGEFLHRNPGIREWFQQLIRAGKKLFLITNSPFQFVNSGMRFMVGEDWESFFDLIIVQARKPMFFTDESRPLRIYDKERDTHLWDKVTEIKKGVIYYEGTLNQLQAITGWKGSEVLYFGDHPYSDLADVTLQHGWRTGAIIQELTHEINTINVEQFKKNCNWLQMLTQLIEECQENDEADAKIILSTWMIERDKIRQDIKKVFNPQFGSVFRTYHNPTYFSRRLFRFADIYTSSITNLLHHSPNHVFYPRRGVMPHEYSSYFV